MRYYDILQQENLRKLYFNKILRGLFVILILKGLCNFTAKIFCIKQNRWRIINSWILLRHWF